MYTAIHIPLYITKNTYGCVWLPFVTTKFPPVYLSGLVAMRLPTQLCSIFIGYLHAHCLQSEVARETQAFPSGHGHKSDHAWYQTIHCDSQQSWSFGLWTTRGCRHFVLPYVVRDITQRYERRQLGSHLSLFLIKYWWMYLHSPFQLVIMGVL